MRRGSFSSGQWSMQTHSAAPIWLTRHSLPAPQCFLAQRLSLRAASSSAKTSIASWMSSCSTACFVPVSSTFFDFLATLRYLLKNDIISLSGNWLFVLKTNSIFTFFSWASTDKSRQAETAKTMSHLNCICEQHQKEKNDLKSFSCGNVFWYRYQFYFVFHLFIFPKGKWIPYCLKDVCVWSNRLSHYQRVCVCESEHARPKFFPFFSLFDFDFFEKEQTRVETSYKGEGLVFRVYTRRMKKKMVPTNTKTFWVQETIKQLDFISPTHFDCWRGIDSTHFFN